MASVFFYAWGEPVLVLLLLFSIAFHWMAGKWIERRHQTGKNAKGVFAAACMVNLGIWILFKYMGPFTAEKEIPLILPIGLSFYTLQALSYLTDIYRKDLQAEKKLLYVGLYLSFFPKLLLGPVIRYGNFEEQIRNRKSTWKKCAVGMCRFTVGMGKKVLLAGNLAILSDIVFSYSAMGRADFQVPAVMAWMGLIAFTLQIYFDFSGYTDMAIGLGLMFGFKLEENFNYPYAAVSVNNFWKRWNISLMNWVDQYVYRPLGGAESPNKDKMVRNLLIAWLMIGMWHGAEATFLLWGLWHFLFVLAERFLGYTGTYRYSGILRIYTLLVVVLGWVLFRAQDVYQAGRFYMNMFACNYNGIWDGYTGFLLKEYWVFLAAGCILCTPIAKKVNNRLVNGEMGKSGMLFTVVYPVVLAIVFIVSISYLVRNGSSGFWYFRF